MQNLSISRNVRNWWIAIGFIHSVKFVWDLECADLYWLQTAWDFFRFITFNLSDYFCNGLNQAVSCWLLEKLNCQTEGPFNSGFSMIRTQETVKQIQQQQRRARNKYLKNCNAHKNYIY